MFILHTKSLRQMAGLLLLLALLFTACKRQGPMGAEGPQGPHGPPGTDADGEDGSSLLTFTATPSTNLQWNARDEWAGYVVYGLGDGELSVTDTLAKVIEEGLAVVSLRSVENDWYKLPWSAGAHREQVYDCAFYGHRIAIGAKTKIIDEEISEPVPINQVKVVIARPASVHTLNLTD